MNAIEKFSKFISAKFQTQIGDKVQIELGKAALKKYENEKNEIQLGEQRRHITLIQDGVDQRLNKLQKVKKEYLEVIRLVTCFSLLVGR